MEEWREIPGTDYSVSSEGRVESRKFGKRRVLSPRISGIGYVRVWVYSGGVKIDRYVHQLVSDVFLDPRPTPEHEVNHKNGNKADNRVENLEWMTHKENIRHRFDVLGQKANGSCARGERVHGAKLTEAGVREIRQRRAAGELLTVIAADYGISFKTVSGIAHGKGWAWLV